MFTVVLGHVDRVQLVGDGLHQFLFFANLCFFFFSQETFKFFPIPGGYLTPYPGTYEVPCDLTLPCPVKSSSLEVN